VTSYGGNDGSGFTLPAVTDWERHVEREVERYRDGESRLGAAEGADARQRQLTRMGNAAAGAGLALLAQARAAEAAEWLARAADRYRESWDGAPPGSWGRPIGILKARILAGDRGGADEAARWTLGEGAAGAESPIGRYAACLALLVLGDDVEARAVASTLRDRDDFPPAVADAVATIAAGDRLGYWNAIEDVLESFETRDEYLEDVPIADTVLVLQELGRRRDVAAELESPLLPGGAA
jgi:hypothetical protein